MDEIQVNEAIDKQMLELMLTIHMQAAGYERESWKIVDGHVIFDIVHNLGTVDDILSRTPEELQQYINGHMGWE